MKVLLLEAGGRDSYHWIHIPIGYLYCMGNPRTDWCMVTEKVPGVVCCGFHEVGIVGHLPMVDGAMVGVGGFHRGFGDSGRYMDT